MNHLGDTDCCLRCVQWSADMVQNAEYGVHGEVTP